MRLFQSGVGNMDLIVKSTHTNTPTTTLPHKQAQTSATFKTQSQIVNKLRTSPSVINTLVSVHRCQFKLLIWLKHAWKPTKLISYESAPKTGFTTLYSKWYTYISDMDKNVRDHYAKPNEKSLILNLVSILGTLYLLYFNKLVLGPGDFQLEPLEVNCSNHESQSHCVTAVWWWTLASHSKTGQLL